ncbi:MAG TPA: sulfite exporter TauE/SafE family protein [Bryobacteraceae bacterium]|nr:sulfite exporter TauE/SafE family protein [Bryobacteraceae bacterium]
MLGLDFLHSAAAFGAAFLAGVINSVAAGGTLITFPTLIWLGLNSVTANATSTVAIWPGTLGSSWGYRRELRTAEPRLFLLVFPSLIGGLVGASLLRITPPAVFDRLVPFLILFATVLFMAQEPVQRRLKSAPAEAHRSAKWLAGALLFQLAVGVYGGYFGAGIGILMLAALSIIGLTDMHQMNGLKVLLGSTINGVAIIYFVANKMVYWPDVVIMVAGSITGGVLGAGFARRLGGAVVRRIVIFVGFALALSFFIRR